MNTTPRKPRTRRQHVRTVKVLIAPSKGQPDAMVRITQDDLPAHYWVSAVSSDYGRAFRVEKPGTEGTDVYDVMLASASRHDDSCTCPGNTWGGYCRHLDALRALDAADLLPKLGSYKPGHDSDLPF